MSRRTLTFCDLCPTSRPAPRVVRFDGRDLCPHHLLAEIDNAVRTGRVREVTLDLAEEQATAKVTRMRR